MNYKANRIQIDDKIIRPKNITSLKVTNNPYRLKKGEYDKGCYHVVISDECSATRTLSNFKSKDDAVKPYKWIQSKINGLEVCNET